MLTTPPDATINLIQDCVSRVTGISRQDMRNKTKRPEVVHARYISWHLMKIYTPIGPHRMLEVFGTGQHGTILNGFRQIESDREIMYLYGNQSDLLRQLIETDRVFIREVSQQIAMLLYEHGITASNYTMTEAREVVRTFGMPVWTKILHDNEPVVCEMLAKL